MADAKDPRVDDYIDPLPEWQRGSASGFARLIHDADPEIEETIKRNGPALLRSRGQRIALMATKGRVNVFLYDGGIAPDPEGIITDGHGQNRADVNQDPRGRVDQ